MENSLLLLYTCAIPRHIFNKIFSDWIRYFVYFVRTEVHKKFRQKHAARKKFLSPRIYADFVFAFLGQIRNTSVQKGIFDQC